MTAQKAATIAAPTVSTTASPQPQSDEKSRKPALTTPTKSTVSTTTAKSTAPTTTAKSTSVVHVPVAEKPTTTKPQAVTATAAVASNTTQAKSNEAVDAVNTKKTPAPAKVPPKSKAAPATPKPAPATPKPEKKENAGASTLKPATPSSVDQKVKRNRLRTIPYQSPIPEIELISKLTAIEANNSTKNSEEKLIIFYK